MDEKLLLAQDVETKLNELKISFTHPIELANRSITLSRNLLRKFKKEIFIEDFKSEKEEIYFLKKLSKYR